ncbi:nucleoside-diphosphate kinase [Candidatus Roizmanbacteria bacterium RIFCSPLOWO2_02_FULL_37_19]|uniref:nucleoside-diphosphate kinase n=1 Tax=Candidatus Roizmanbacteria bacterium RIFCSPHIGHO2_02_FULL_37_24 TaxID=1802037 RepID=A0A1F7GVX1_9BACT|nr:MAG: nucleoside-diphosphate kinase [Candidatus Roizmanbacteria bacterium RIFCSPHIGHO2_01_FULL_38_41]OGK23128.1 MAG: nucleoside-diphosphate kinase [Candidatus Roizmanbacteria bacterium RIFCSPHIGHO2_02_FULL_37_24]OGK32851.1 MAG: nucleoside-diphosphate kinase [Candidatus Roizmanbacteria bacterium RIFCSPHIGHO2_12_FULL_37_23]OGK45472.1 MAG: nucleoside-diphosphate kinase [Candidatus Roizmanbacteria bacterium RIFCSPLOWO2_01_FULL_37_57]OGK54264.1 MAG: nucleoside-diphosphate kinase [Candidatus Roizma
MIEQTLVVIKHDGLARGLVGDIVSRFERVGLKLVATRLVKVESDLAEKHYPLERREFIEGMGKKTIENYQALGKDVKKEMGTEDPHEIGKEIRKWLIDYIQSGPVFAMVWEGPHAVELVRKICGHTLPLLSPVGTIRGDLAHDSSYLANTGKRAIKNLVHASGSVDEAEYEIPLWFNIDDIYSYERVEEKVMR